VRPVFEEFTKKENRIAVAGASSDASKWGARMVRKLLDVGYAVYGVNPKGCRIDGIQCHRSIASIRPAPDVVITVVPPAATAGIVRECADAGVSMVWMQPGSESQEALELAGKSGIKAVSGRCFVTDGLQTGW